jgi:glycosyltransferase involved in cell wall biosynthesis
LSRKIHIVAYVHAYPPHHNAGAEWMLHSMLRDMVRRGHTASVLINFKDIDRVRAKSRHPREQRYEFEGVTVWDFAGNAEKVLPKADIVITHLEKGSNALHGAPHWCSRYRKPLARLVHNDRELFYFKAARDTSDLVIFNSLWLQAAYNATLTADWPQIVVRPPVDPAYYATDNTGAKDITLINLTENKGAKLFYDLARAMRGHSFLAVKGGYDQQMIDSGVNLQVIENQSDIRPVYARTRVLLVPSLIETYGRVAVEAMASGIPVIANETAGLREACGDAAVFLDRNKPHDWIDELKRLDDPAYYAKRSKAAKERATYLWEHQMAGDLDGFEQAIINSIDTYKGKREMVTIKPEYKAPETITVVARRNFRHKGKQYEQGVTQVPADDLGFLLGRMLIELLPAEKPKAIKAEKVEAAVRDDKTDKVATTRKTKAVK